MAAGFAVYANSFSGAFVFDDENSILDKGRLWRDSSLWGIISSQNQTPVLAVTLALNYRLGGDNPFGYHLVNLAIHVLAGLTLFGLVRRTLLLADCGLRIADGTAETEDRRPKAEGQSCAFSLQPSAFSLQSPFRNPHRQIRNTLLALVVALLWLVHPLQTESVTYIIQRKESLMGLFYLLTLYLLVRSHAVRRHWPWLAASAVACALGMGTKRVMLTAPILALLYDRTFLSGSFRKALARSWPYYLLLAGTWGLLVTSLGRLQEEGLGLPQMKLSPLDHALSQFGVVLHYLRLAFWPSGLCLDYGWPVARELWQYLPQAVVVLALLAVTVVLFFWKAPAAGFLGVWFFGILAPTSSVIVIPDLAFEHRMYLPLAAVAALVVLGAFLLGRRLLGRLLPAERTRRLVGWVLSATVTIVATAALGAATMARNGDYRSAGGLWQDAVGKYPDNPRSHYNLATYLFRSGDADGAIEHYTRALELAHNNYAAAYAGRGLVHGLNRRYELAAQDCQRAVVLNPKFVDAHYNLALALTGLDRLDLAVGAYSDVIGLQPDHVLAHINRGLLYERMARQDEALRDYSRAVELRSVEGFVKRAELYGKTGRLAQAMADLNQAIALKPDYGLAYLDRAVGYFEAKDYAKAWADVEQARKHGCPPQPAFLKALSEASGRSAVRP